MINGPILVLTKRKRCDAGCGYDKSMTEAAPNPVLTHQEQEYLLGTMKFQQPPFVKGHKHHFVRTSTIEILPKPQ